MTSDELIKHFKNTYGFHKEWPKTYEVDAETYANCCQAIFDWVNKSFPHPDVRVQLGIEHNGLMFKNVELIYKTKRVIKHHTCDNCNGTGTIHSHNNICDMCDGKGWL